MKFTLLATIAFTTILFSCNSSQPGDLSNDITAPIKEEVVRELTPEELRAELKQKECDNATDYLDGNMKYEGIYKGLLSLKINGIKMNCTIRSTSTVATFKNMVAHVSFISKTDAVVIEQDVAIYEFVQPGGSIVYKGEIECTNQQWNDIADVRWNFKSAECE